MGKCKRRTLNKPILEKPLSRSDAVDYIIYKIKGNELDITCKKFITLFGITPEELTEAGADYEEVMILRRFM